MAELTGNKCYVCGAPCYTDHEIKGYCDHIYFCSKHCNNKFYGNQQETANMIIIFNGDTLDLLNRLEQFSGKDQKLTLDFMLQNFKTLDTVEDNIASIETMPPHPYAPVGTTIA